MHTETQVKTVRKWTENVKAKSLMVSIKSENYTKQYKITAPHQNCVRCPAVQKAIIDSLRNRLLCLWHGSPVIRPLSFSIVKVLQRQASHSWLQDEMFFSLFVLNYRYQTPNCRTMSTDIGLGTSLPGFNRVFLSQPIMPQTIANTQHLNWKRWSTPPFTGLGYAYVIIFKLVQNCTAFSESCLPPAGMSQSHLPPVR